MREINVFCSQFKILLSFAYGTQFDNMVLLTAKNKIMKALLPLLLALSVIPFAANGQSESTQKRVGLDNTPVDSLDLERYMGLWYEVARIDHRFQRGMSDCTARYTIVAPERVEVVNSGIRDGRLREAHATAWPADGSGDGHLRVRFFLIPADYLVLELDRRDYRYTVVGGSSPNYLWIMSRTPQMAPDTLARLVDNARLRGYHTENLIYNHPADLTADQSITHDR